MQASEAVPFLSKPPKLDSSMPGYCGFDPLRISDAFDVKYLQASFCISRVLLSTIICSSCAYAVFFRRLSSRTAVSPCLALLA